MVHPFLCRSRVASCHLSLISALLFSGKMLSSAYLSRDMRLLPSCKPNQLSSAIPNQRLHTPCSIVNVNKPITEMPADCERQKNTSCQSIEQYHECDTLVLHLAGKPITYLKIVKQVVHLGVADGLEEHLPCDPRVLARNGRALWECLGGVAPESGVKIGAGAVRS